MAIPPSSTSDYTVTYQHVPQKQCPQTVATTVTFPSLTKKIQSENYNLFFNYTDGSSMRWGKTIQDNPIMAPAPGILIFSSTLAQATLKATLRALRH